MKHLSSFLSSILLHAIILFGAYLLYQHTISVVNKKEEKKEKKICINLKQCIAKTNSKLKKPILKKTQQKTTKKKQPHKKNKPKKKKKPIKRKKKIIHKKKIIKQKKPIKKIKHKKIQKKPLKKKDIKSDATEKKPQIAPKPSIKKVKTTNNAVITPIPKKTYTKKIKPKKTYTQEYLDRYLSRIHNLIAENIYYPRKARRRKIEGKVVLKFKILQSGDIKDIYVVSSSHSILSKAAKRTIEEISSSVPKPKEEITLTLPIEFKLHN